jgi:hypothetical protein
MFTVFLVVGASLRPVLANELKPGSKWMNKYGAALTIERIGSDGVVIGTYIAKAGCEAAKMRPLTGWYNNGTFVLAVTLEECASVIAWAGRIETDGARPKLVALWHRVSSDAPRGQAILAGADLFRLAP